MFCICSVHHTNGISIVDGLEKGQESIQDMGKYSMWPSVAVRVGIEWYKDLNNV